MDAKNVDTGSIEIPTPRVIKILHNLLKQNGANRVKLVDSAIKANEILWMGWEVDGRVYKVYQFNESDELVVGGLTPKQAVLATMGEPACDIEQVTVPASDGSDFFYGFRCRGCGYQEGYYKDKALFLSAANWDYCPKCGSHVKRDAS